MINECFDKLGPYIKSCHAKDIALEDSLTVHLNEKPAGTGFLDYKTYIRRLSMLPEDTPLMLEHLNTHEEVLAATANIRETAKSLGIML